jgi:hypothetical protein
MIDWSKVGPANAPGPKTPDTTAPIAPVTPATPTVAQTGTNPLMPTIPMSGGGPTGQTGYQTGGNPWTATQADVDALDPGARIGRGIDVLGSMLFGEGAPLKGVPLLGDALKGLGDAGHSLATTTVIKPIEAGAGAIARVPMGWLPGGADETFNRLGEWASKADPKVRAEWELVNAAANADVLYGGNLKADFNIEVMKYIEDQSYDSTLGVSPELAMHAAGVGSLGGALSNAIQGFLGIGSNLVQRGIEPTGLVDPYYNPGTKISHLLDAVANPTKYVVSPGASANLNLDTMNDFERYAVQNVQSGKWTDAQAQEWIDKNINEKLGRVEEAAVRLETGMEVSDVEKQAVEAWKSGLWSREHAMDYIVSHGQGITRNPIGQIAGTLVTDPLTWATLGAGGVAGAGAAGLRGAEAAGVSLKTLSMSERLAYAAQQATALEKAAAVSAAVRVDPVLGPVSRFARGMIDPLAVYKPSSVATATVNLMDDHSIAALGRTYGNGVRNVRALGREFGVTSEVDSALASYTKDQSALMIARVEQRRLLEQGLGEDMVHTNVDEVIAPMMQAAPREAVDQLVDHMTAVRHNVFTAEDDLDLAGRMSIMYGKDVPYWQTRLQTMDNDTRSLLHATTYKNAEAEHARAMAQVDTAAYDGDLPLGNMVLMSDTTLDDVLAKDIIDNITSVLKNKDEPERIAAATAEWNGQAARYPKMANLGYATGGKEQVEALVKQLQKELDAGRITKRAADTELAHPGLKPVRDMLDRHSVPTEVPLTPSEVVARQKQAAADAAAAVHKLGFREVGADRFFARITLAQKVVKSNGRTVGETVYRYPKKAYKDMRLFLTEDGKTGFAIKPDGDVVSVFNVGEKGLIQKAVPHWPAMGGTKMDAFDEAGRLPELYGQGGFVEVARDPWNPEYAPKPWTGGTPDVVYFEHPTHATRTASTAEDAARSAKYEADMAEYAKAQAKYETDKAAWDAARTGDPAAPAATDSAAYTEAKAKWDADTLAFNQAKANHDAAVAKYEADSKAWDAANADTAAKEQAHAAAQAKYEEDLKAYNEQMGIVDGAPADFVPHTYHVSTRSAGQGKTGYHYDISGTKGGPLTASSKETYPTEEAAMAAGQDYAQRMAEKVRQDLGYTPPAPAPKEGTYAAEKAKYDAEKKAYDDAVAASEDEMNSGSTPERVAEVTAKWRDRTKSPSKLRIDLEKLSDEGYDVGEVDSMLDEYTDMERDGMTMEEFGDEKQAAWDEMMDRLDETAPIERDLPDEPIAPVEPVKPKPPLSLRKDTPEIGDRFNINDGRIWHMYGTDPATGDILLGRNIDKATGKAEALSSVPAAKPLHWEDGRWTTVKTKPSEAASRPVAPDAFTATAPGPEPVAPAGAPVAPVKPTAPREKPMFDPALSPSVPGARRLWKVGFRPDEEVAWGLRRDAGTGRYVIDRDPTISHVVDAVPGRQPFSDTTRNVLGQIVGKSKAERLNKPIDSLEAFFNTQRDVVTGRRLVMNIEQRYERIAVEAGIPQPIAKEIFTKAREVAQIDQTTIRGLSPKNVWQAVHEIVPRDLVLKNGQHVNIHVVMDHLLKASEGDLRIMGVTSTLSQRMRNRLRAMGDGSNFTGQLTVTLYNRLRYSMNPMFLIQRVTDAPYYSILYGVTPVGKVLNEADQALKAITENLARSGMARDFSMDMPEYATRSNFSAGIKSLMQQAGLKDNMLQRILDAPDLLIANNMTHMLHARLGDMVRGALDNLAAVAEKDPALKAEMLKAGGDLTNTFEDWRAVYSNAAGRVLDDNEVGLRYIQDQLNAWRRHAVRADGTIDMSKLIHEGERSMPSSIADIGPIRPDDLAQELGYPDAAALRKDTTGSVAKVNGEFQMIKGEHDVPWLEETLRTQHSAHPDYVRRVSAYFSDTWDGFWHKLSLSTDAGGLDITAHYAKEAQDVIAREALSRGMDPWEYLSGVMASNIGAADVSTHIGKLMEFLKTGKSSHPIEEWTKLFRAHLDVSAQETLMEEFAAATGKASPAVKPATFTFVTPPSAPGKAARPPVAKVPAVFRHEPGYAYRVETPAAMESGLPTKSGVTTGTPTAFYEGKNGVQKGIFRVKDDGTFTGGRHGPGGADRMTSRAIPPEEIEMLAADGTWVRLEADPYDNFFANNFPQMVKDRITSGKPHKNPEVEGYMQALSKWVNDTLGPELAGQTRTDLRKLVEAIPQTHPSNFNRSQALVVSLLKNKIEDAQQDIFRLAEMQTKRSVIERSLNHPLFGLYPVSYMWGKVLPETVKFLAKNPYAATYMIADVQRAIAIQREYDPEMDNIMGGVDRSSSMFLLDYLTPGLPWSDHQARMSPMFRDIIEGKDIGMIWRDELATISPQRWVSQVVNSANEIPGALDTINAGPSTEPQFMSGLQDLAGGAQLPAAVGAQTEQQITGPTKASALAPILRDDLSRLSSILLEGKDAEE